MTAIASDSVRMGEQELAEIEAGFDGADPSAVIAWALERFAAHRVALCTSFQRDGMVILDMACRINPRPRVITIDTGRLPQETHDMIDRVRDRYGITVEVFVPDAREVGSMVTRHGANLFRQSIDLRVSCCEARKVRPLGRALEGLDAWMTGLRRDQWATRARTRKVELDRRHDGIVKINPLADWTEQQVLTYVKANRVPRHPLYDRGYATIGCAPCTRPIAPGEETRMGRWWWEDDGHKECGIHGPASTSPGG